jgi:hypothetical protein
MNLKESPKDIRNIHKYVFHSLCEKYDYLCVNFVLDEENNLLKIDITNYYELLNFQISNNKLLIGIFNNYPLIGVINETIHNKVNFKTMNFNDLTKSEQCKVIEILKNRKENKVLKIKKY